MGGCSRSAMKPSLGFTFIYKDVTSLETLFDILAIARLPVTVFGLLAFFGHFCFVLIGLKELVNVVYLLLKGGWCNEVLLYQLVYCLSYCVFL